MVVEGGGSGGGGRWWCIGWEVAGGEGEVVVDAVWSGWWYQMVVLVEVELGSLGHYVALLWGPVFGLCDLCLACVWSVFGLSVVCLWPVFGLCLACVWPVFGMWLLCG